MTRDWSRDRAARQREALRRRRRCMAALLFLAGAVCFVVCFHFFGGSAGSPSARAFQAGADGGGAGRESLSSAAAVAGSVLKSASSVAETAPSAGSALAAGQTQLSDPLLLLVNGWNPLPDSWQVDLVPISDEESVDARMYDDFMAMYNAAGEDGIWFWVASSYRSVEQQEIILERAIQSRMNEKGMSREEAEEDALRTIARPGYSEHHTGLAIDLNSVSDDFESTAEYAWLCEHAAEYGFVQRYRLDKVELTGIDNESWHYRYVGREHAQEMERLDMCLEEYTDYLKGRGG